MLAYEVPANKALYPTAAGPEARGRGCAPDVRLP